MITIYHNPRCSKSRECTVFLGASGKEIEVINYIETPFTIEKLTQLIALLGIEPIELVRTNEAIWKEKFKGRKMRDTTIIKAMITANMVRTNVNTGNSHSSHLSIAFPPKAPLTMITIICNARVEYLA